MGKHALARFSTWKTQDGVRVFGVGNFTFGREKAGTISPGPCWFCYYGCWGHYCGGFFELWWDVYSRYKNDQCLIG